MEKLDEIENDLNSALGGSNQKPVIVEVATDSSGAGYPLRIITEDREYR